MSVSLYAIGPAKIEIGQYGYSLTRAKEIFLQICENFGIDVDEEIEDLSGVKFTLSNDIKLHNNLGRLLCSLANVEDLHGDPPDTYILCENGVPDGVYRKTGTYND